ncbi:hypothetical protein V3C99_016574, partial [Haemonchus contortus]
RSSKSTWSSPWSHWSAFRFEGSCWSVWRSPWFWMMSFWSIRRKRSSRKVRPGHTRPWSEARFGPVRCRC